MPCSSLSSGIYSGQVALCVLCIVYPQSWAFCSRSELATHLKSCAVQRMHEVKVHAEYLDSGDWCFGSSLLPQPQLPAIENGRRRAVPITSSHSHVGAGTKHLPSPPTACAVPAGPTHRRATVTADCKACEVTGSRSSVGDGTPSTEGTQASHSGTGPVGYGQASSKGQARDGDRTTPQSVVAATADADEDGT